MKQRIITGVILIVLVALGIRFLSNHWFSALSLSVLVTLAGLEWTRLVSFEGNKKVIYIVSALFGALLMYFLPSFAYLIVLLAAILWLVNTVLVFRYSPEKSFYTDNNAYMSYVGGLLLLAAWYSISQLHLQNLALVFYIVALVAIADSGAYFSGKKFGKKKLAKQLSPGKTIEGVLGGLSGVFIWSILGAFYFGVGFGDGFWFVLISLFAALISVVGDLFESLLKRKAGVKDSGDLLPGHGGVLDRVDGLIAVLPIFVIGLSCKDSLASLFQI